MVQFKLRDIRLRYVIAAAVVLVLLTGIAFESGSILPAKSLPPLTVPVYRSDLEVTVGAHGTLEPSELVAVGAQVTGQITTLNVVLGERVHRGQIVANIDSDPFEYALRSAQASLDNLIAQERGQEAALVLARANYKRQKALIAVNGTSQQALDEARKTLDDAQAQVESYKAQIAGARISVRTAALNISYTRISTPIDGTVVAVMVQKGQTVTAGYSTPTIVMIADLKTMIVKANISEADVARVKPGQKAYFTTLGDTNRKYWGILESIDPVPDRFIDAANGKSGYADNGAIYYNGRLRVANPDGKLRPNMTVEVNFVLAQAQKALTVPSAALMPGASPNHQSLKILEPDGKIKTRDVVVGLDNGVQAQVLEGVGEGDKVVLETVFGAGEPK
jgi:membrane fusion protein, macrolide-specific efflux system